MYKKIKRNNKTKNQILKYLNKTSILKSESIRVISLATKLDMDLLFTVSEDLENDKYITTSITHHNGIDHKIVKITRKGRLFINDSGYTSSGSKITINAIKNNEVIIVSIIVMIIGFLSYLSSN